MKRSIWPVVLFILGCAGMVFSFILQTRTANRLEKKAKAYDEICLATKARLSSNIFFLTRPDSKMRELTLEQFDERNIADLARMYDWCTIGPEDGRSVAFSLHELAMCRDEHNLPCIVDVLKGIKARIPQEPPQIEAP